jgi:hypothetical protein
MSFNANTIYKAVDLDDLANECMDAVTKNKVYAITDTWGHLHSIYNSRQDAQAKVQEFNKGDPDGYWTIEEHGLR